MQPIIKTYRDAPELKVLNTRYYFITTFLRSMKLKTRTIGGLNDLNLFGYGDLLVGHLDKKRFYLRQLLKTTKCS